MILKFTSRILRKEKGKLFLPFISILFTTVVVVLAYFLISSTNKYLISKNKEFLGGDIVLRSPADFDVSKYIDNNLIIKQSNQLNFDGLINYKDTGIGVDFTFVDNNFPLYGEIKLQNNNYDYLLPNQIYIDQNLYKRYNLQIGEEVFFNEKSFIVKDIIIENPENVVSGFSFSPKIILSKEAIIYANIDLSYFRKDFRKKIVLNKEIDIQNKAIIKNIASKNGVNVTFLGESGGLQFGIDIVEKFLFVVITVIIILALVNIYASINFLTERLRRSFAIFMSIGMEVKQIYKILFLINSSVVLIAGIFGILIAYYISNIILFYVKSNLKINLTHNMDIANLFMILCAVYITSIFAIIPIIRRLKDVSPKELLSNIRNVTDNKMLGLSKDIIFAILPIAIFAIYFLNSFLYAMLLLFVIIFIYGIVMFFYRFIINFLYKHKDNFSFPVRMIISQKKFDGVLGMITFASLFVALTAVYSLSILRTSIERYLDSNLRKSMPSVYVVDLQKSQIDNFKNRYPEVNLFPNVRARLASIDGIDIQQELNKNNSNMDQELKREFNLTYSQGLLNNDKVIDGNFNTTNEGEVSLEKSFADKIGANIGSTLKVNIQGLEVETKVTSIREVDNTSGLPFFYLIYSPQELQKFPATFFGYMYMSQDEINNLYRDLPKDFPNLSIINTANIVQTLESVIQILIFIILIITIPPIILSTLLIVSIIASLSKDRKRDGARLIALGKTKDFVRNYFIFETTSTTLMSSMAAYIFSIFIVNIIILFYIKIKNVVYIDKISLYIFLILCISIICLGILLWYKDKKNIKEYLNYEEND